MNGDIMDIKHIRTRWAAVGAAVAITLGAGGIGITHATTSSGQRAIYTPINPCRLADTRPDPFTVGPRTTGLGAGETYTLSGWGVIGDCDLPTGTVGLVLNVTADAPTDPTFLRLWPADGVQPTTSNLNPWPGEPPTPNAVNVGLSAAGQFSVYNRFGTVSVIIDVVGVYDDHNHDDRYYRKGQTYTQAEVDAAVTGAKSVAEYAGGNQDVALTSTATVIRSVTLEAPAAGTVIVESSGYIYVNGGAALNTRCSITTGTIIDITAMQWTQIDNGKVWTGNSISGTRGFDVTAGQSLTANLVCDELSGDSKIADTWMSAIFVPD